MGLVHAASLLGKLGKRNPANQAAIAAAGAIPALSQLLDSCHSEVQGAAAQALEQLRSTPAQQPSRPHAGSSGIGRLVTELSSGSVHAKVVAALALQGLAKDPSKQQAIVSSGGIPALVRLLGNGSWSVQAAGAEALALVADGSTSNQDAIAAADAIPALVRLLGSSNEAVQFRAASALGRAADGNSTNHAAISAAGAVPALSHLLDSSNPDVHQAAAATLELLASTPEPVYPTPEPVQSVTPAMSSLRPPPANPGSAGDHQQAWQIRYEELQLELEIGRGSFGTVHLADWRATPVAVKQLNEMLGTGSQSSPVLAALRRESDIMRRLSHPNCVLLMGVCTSPPAVITEYCERGCLMDVLHEAVTDAVAASQLTWLRRLSMALDAARGMHYLHSHSPPIIHRDLKSPNLLVTRGWQVKVADFNLSLLVESMHSKMTMVTQPRWLAPEVMDGGQSTTASDVYAFGVVLWELLTWKEPWHDVTNPAQIMVKVLVHQKRPEIPAIEAVPGADTPQVTRVVDAFVALMRRCWDQDPNARPAFKAVAEQLSQLEASACAAAARASGAGPTPDGGASSSLRVKECPICFGEFSLGDMSCLVPCGPGPLCGGCTDKVAQPNKHCPICKTKITAHVPANFRMFSC
ncbi:hypothetical protein D9Q98_004244 [Chlorella vulgaris]|uniref:Uncharacterized protein n=1 Tax=Chlorella vulgaris TaxID=3077 RepID=A0A9D4YYD7_CHLVU|nr:hypothetical protein D9Q98_004244 [Chlorella vulgaris]